MEDELARERADELEERAGTPVHRISSAMGEGVDALLRAARALVREDGSGTDFR